MSYKKKFQTIIGDLTNQLEELRQEEIKLNENKATYSDIYYKEQLTEINRAKQQLRSNTESKYNDYTKDLNGAITNWSLPKGSDIDDDIKLLNGSINLTQDEITALGVKHSKNNTMSRAIREYATKNELYFGVTTGDESMRKSQQNIDSHFKRAMNNLDSYSLKVLQDDTSLDELTGTFDLLDRQDSKPKVSGSTNSLADLPPGPIDWSIYDKK